MNRIAVMASILLLASGWASAETLYKLIHKDGRVTYSETAPEKFDGQVIRMDIDPNANTATLPKPPAPNAGAPKVPGDSAGAPTPADTARAKVEKARKALEDARDRPADSDFRRLGSATGGARPVPTDEYLERLAALEQALKKAQSEARQLEDAK